MSSGSYPSFFRAWTQSSTHIFNSLVEANRAAVAAFGVSSDDDEPTEARIAPDDTLEEWDVDCSLRRDDALSVGDSVRFSKTLSDCDVVRFAAASGDTNPIHLDSEWAKETRFDGRIVHGVLVTGLISAALARLPGDVIYLSQNVEFLRPVRIGDRTAAVVEVAEDLGGDRYRLSTKIFVDEELVVDGEATILTDEPPA